MATVPRQTAEIDPLAVLSSSTSSGTAATASSSSAAAAVATGFESSPNFYSNTIPNANINSIPRAIDTYPSTGSNYGSNNLNLAQEFAAANGPGRLSPQVSARIQSTDALKFAMDEFLHKCRTTAVDTTTVLPNPSGIQLFARIRAWEDVVNASAKLITKDQPGFNAGTLSLVMKFRLEGLFRMKMFDELLVEANKIITTEESRLEPLLKDQTMKLLVSEVKAMMGRYDEAMEQLYTIRALLTKHSSALDNENHDIKIKIINAEFWIWKVRSGIVNASIRQRHWRISIFELLSMIQDIQTLMNKYEKDENVKRVLLRPLIILLCRSSRAFLQMGTMQGAMDCYVVANNSLQELKSIVSRQNNSNNTTSSSSSDASNHSILSDLVDQVELAEGLLKFGCNNFVEAMTIFSNLISREKVKQRTETLNALSFFTTATTTLSSSNKLSNSIVDGNSNNSSNNNNNSSNQKISVEFFESIVVVEDSIFAVAVNNYAICALNLRRIKLILKLMISTMQEAVISLESLIQEDPARYLNDALVFNLCTLYDLTCPPELGNIKKKVLHAISLTFHVGEPIINWKSFRLS